MSARTVSNLIALNIPNVKFKPSYLLTLLAFAATTFVATAGEKSARPNIIFILADDLGWRDVGCFGSTFYETPNIDRLATRGVKLTQAYAASPLCSPTRSSIQAGQYPARTGITTPDCHLKEVRLEKKLGNNGPTVKVINAVSLTRLKSEYFTLAESFHEAGYATAHFGKWHLGFNLNKNDHYEPKDRGFDVDFPHTPAAAGPGGGYLAPWKFITDPTIVAKPGEHIEDRMSSEAAKYILAHKGQPFYINYCAFSVHGPWNARKDYIEHFQSKVDKKNPQHNPLYAAMVHSLDDGVGRILAAVDAAGIADKTIIVFFSDNGGYAYLPTKATDPEGFENEPATSNLPLRSGKASLYEGGTREPCIVVWPNKIKPRTVNETSLLQSTDFYPTLLAMCGLKPHAAVKLDGFDQTGMLLGKGEVRDRVFCHFPHGNDKTAADMPGFKPGTYVRRGDWKLIRFYGDNDDGSDRLELYNLRTDIGESNNVAAANPELVKELNALIGGFLRDTEAVVPIRNPNYKKSAASADPLQGWAAKACKTEIVAGVLRVEADGKEPFLGNAQVKASGPFTVKLRIRSTAGGAGKIQWRTDKQETLPPEQSVSFEVKAGDEWQDVSVELPVKGRLALFRIYLPADKSPVEIANVNFISTATKKSVRAWNFGAIK